jgi:AcrR family transcriptional regulator
MPRARSLPAAVPIAPAADGRQRRSERSREAIVQALLDLVGAGVQQPTAQQVAASAGVGIRSVFRHFADMESLYAEMDVRVQAMAVPVLRAAPIDGSITARTRGLVARRVDFFERIAPYKRAASALRWRSAFLARQHGALVRELRADLARWLPELRRAPADRVEAFDVALSFETWDRLRSDQRLGRDRARAALERLALALTESLAR